MRGLYIVRQALPRGRYKLKLDAGSYGKIMQVAAEHILWRGEWTPYVCATFFESKLFFFSQLCDELYYAVAC